MLNFYFSNFCSVLLQVLEADKEGTSFAKAGQDKGAEIRERGQDAEDREGGEDRVASRGAGRGADGGVGESAKTSKGVGESANTSRGVGESEKTRRGPGRVAGAGIGGYEGVHVESGDKAEQGPLDKQGNVDSSAFPIFCHSDY